eukprot:COSAG01_NODE_3183_length_6447_cov_3.930687_4_plen_78_part_00
MANTLGGGLSHAASVRGEGRGAARRQLRPATATHTAPALPFATAMVNCVVWVAAVQPPARSRSRPGLSTRQYPLLAW